MKVLIIGFGSIGQKHATALMQMDSSIELLALRSLHGKVINNPLVKTIMNWNLIPKDINFILISNPTGLHEDTLIRAVNLKKPIFLEKPPLHRLDLKETILSLVKKFEIPVYCAFNMKFDPLIQWLKVNIDPLIVLEVNSYCGSYLPDWRKNEDYRNSYSAKKSLGGGVHLDLIHEIDFITWIFGKPTKTVGIAQKNSKLEIDSFDNATYTLIYDHALIKINLNYFRRRPKRSIELVTHNDIIEADLLNGVIRNAENKILFQNNSSISETYLNQMIFFVEHLKKNKAFEFNSLEQGLDSLEICLNINTHLK